MKAHVTALLTQYIGVTMRVRLAGREPNAGIFHRMDWPEEQAVLRREHLRAGAIGRRRLRREWRWAVDGRSVQP